MSSCTEKGCKKCSKCRFYGIVIAIILIACAIIYIVDYYHADDQAIEAYIEINQNEITTETLEEDNIAFIPQDPKAGFIFYPGGKVEAASYEPLMTALAKHGILCILTEMPANLAVLDVKAADGLFELYEDIDAWYIGGHSLGGSMAASYASDRADQLNGVVLLGSYSTADLKQTGLEVLTIYGSEDKVLNKMKYEENLANLPKGYAEFIIDGGCHAGFGMYGPQDGDGKPEITAEEQIEITADKIAEWMGGNYGHK
ncbi:MAG: alpha/beta hydrolase [Bacillota bacterium]|nr:alpha/beta hydrolase [Bacillota bacterium]